MPNADRRRQRHRAGMNSERNAGDIGRCSGTDSLQRRRETDVDLPEGVVGALAIALADERLAFATYSHIIESFGPVRPFINIAKAEQRHISALLNLYGAYAITPPADETKVDPAVETSDLRTLCEKGVEGEAENIRLYDEQLLPAVSGYPRIERVLKNLRDASALRHKPAFERCVSRLAQTG